jgi:hypothetical protein
VGRVAALLILLGALVAWFEATPHLDPVSEWQSVVLLSFVVMPAMFGLVWLALPLVGETQWLVVGSAGLLGSALVCGAFDWQVPENFAKFGAMTCLGWLFLKAFEELSWVVIVSLAIPFVDAYSVWRGPTHSITQHHAGVFTTFSVAFPVPGGSAARLGLTDVLFFAIFLGAAARFRLRPFPTWLLMVAGLGITITLTTYWSTGGLPALPAISLGFLIANADLLWRRVARPVLGARSRAT